MARLPLLEIDDDLYIQAEKVVAVKGMDECKCALWFAGQSAVDGGFLLNRPAEDVVLDIDEHLSEDEA